MSTSRTSLDALRRRIRANAALPSPEERRALRRAAGLTLADIAGAAGVSVPTVSMWERGTRTPSGLAREAYIRVLQVVREETSHRQAA